MAGTTRELNWDGLFNARDMGGVPLTGNGVTQSGRIVRSDHPSKLTPTGWAALRSYGVRTIVSFETANLPGRRALEENPVVPIPEGTPRIVHVRVPVQDGSDEDFMSTWAATGRSGTPVYFHDALTRWPQYYANALCAVAAAPGAVLMHCGRGQHRTGLVAALVLAIAGASPEAMADDYMFDSTGTRRVAPGVHRDVRDAALQRKTTVLSIMEQVSAFVRGRELKAAGLDEPIKAQLRAKLLTRRDGSVQLRGA